MICLPTFLVQTDVEKAERDKRRRRAELVIQQATLESELEFAQARQDLDEAVTDKKSAISRVRWQDNGGNQTENRSLTLHNALQPTARPFVPRMSVSKSLTANLNVQHTSRSEYPDLSAIVSPLITTTAATFPAFFDDREHLLTGMAADNTERGRFASTSLPNMVTNLSDTVYMSPVTNTPHKDDLLSSTTRPSITEAGNEIIMRGSRPQVPQTLPTHTGAGQTITTSAPTYRNFGDSENGFRLLRQQAQQTTKTGYVPPNLTDTNSQIAAALERLAQSNEAALLPKSEIIRFDGDAKNY